MHQRNHGRIADSQAVNVRHRQSEARALKQSTCRPHIQEGDYPRRDAALCLDLRGSEALPQFSQRISTCERGKQQAVRLQNAADLDKRTRKIIDELEREGRHEEIERALAKRQHLLVGDSGEAIIQGRVVIRPCQHIRGRRARGEDDANVSGTDKLPFDGIAWSAEIDRPIEPPQHGCEPFGELLRNAVQKERGWPEFRGTVAARTQQRSVENQRG